MIVITTPTGAIGRKVLAHLLERGAPVRVIARDPEQIPAQTRDRVEVIEGSHGDAKVVTKAFAGAEAVFWVVPPNPRAESLTSAYLDFTRPACEAIKTQQVKRVVTVSALGRGTKLADRAGLVTASLKMEDLLASAGVNFRALTMPSFMDNLLRQVDAIRDKGLFFSPITADRKLPTCATRDIAAVAAELLLDNSWMGQGSVAVLGPEDLSGNDMAEIISDVLGKPVRYQRTPFDAFEAQLKKNRMSEAFVRGYVEMMKAKDQGLDNAEPRTAEATSSTTFREWCKHTLKPAVEKQAN